MRSWDQNVPEIDDVVMVGSPQQWVKAPTIRYPQLSTKYNNTTRGLLHVCSKKLVPNEFILLNDDFFALRGTTVPAWHRGPMLEVVDAYRSRGINSNYVQGMEATAKALIRDGVQEPKCFEVHAPMYVQRDLMAHVLDTYSKDPSISVLHKRSAYSNLAGGRGVQVEDVKLRVPEEIGDSAVSDGPVWKGTLPDMDWVSTSDRVWAAGAGSLLTERFDASSRWEVSTLTRVHTSPGRVRWSA